MNLATRAIGTFAYYVARGIVDIMNVVWWRTSQTGSENIPKTGPFILALVHRSNLDGPIAASITRRRMRFLAKGELFKYKKLGDLFIAMGAIPVNRGTPDRKSLNSTIEQLQSGWPIVIFPEGGRFDGPILSPLQEGVAYLALRAGVPIVPVGIGGSERSNPRKTFFIRPTKITIAVGEPIEAKLPEGTTRVSRSAISETTEALTERIQALFDQAEAKL